MTAALAAAALVLAGAVPAFAVPIPYTEGFESGLNGWVSTTTSGLCSWRVLNKPENISVSAALNPFCVTLPDTGAHLPAAGGTNVVWFGEESTGTFIGSNYPAQTAKQGGTSAATQTGTLTSPVIALTGVTKAQLEFDAWWEIEGVAGNNYDVMEVFISTDGSTYTSLGKLNPNFATAAPADSGYTAGGSSAAPVWRHYSFDVSAYVGNNVYIRFSFNSRDTQYNAFRGWTVDNVSVSGGATLPGPTITSVVANVGTAGDVVTINGTNFQQGATFWLGSTQIPASSITQFGTNILVFLVPSLTAGTYNVRVVNPDTQSFTLTNGFTYTTAASPTVTSVSPATANVMTAQAVTITGANFVAGATVTVGGVAATGCTVASATSITCTFPAMVAGNYNVIVTNPSGQTGTRYAGYSVQDTSVVAVTSPNGGESWNAGTVHAVTWTATGTTTVSLDLFKNGVWVADIASSIPATPGSFSWTIPPAIAGGTDYRVRVFNPNGTKSDLSDANFTIVAYVGDIPPTLTVSSGTTQFLEDGAPVLVDGAMELTDPDGPNLTGARVSIGSGFVPAQDRLAFTAQGGITGSYDTATGILTLTGSATAATYQAALRSVTYQNIQTNNPTAGTRQITFSVGATSLFFPDNGHYYEFVTSSGISWTAARDAAALRRYYGLQGYLTTITSAAENSFVSGKLAGEGWMGASDAAVEWTWRWVTGPEGLEDSGAGRHFFTEVATCTSGPRGSAVGGYYQNWNNCEPNDSGGEDYAHFLIGGLWNDYPLSLGSIAGYVVEYGGMPGDPTPVLNGTKAVSVTACETSCSTCSSGTVCTACDSGFSLVGGDCLAMSTTTTVTASTSPSVFGQAVTFTATVVPAAATGTVQFQINGVNFGSPVALSGGTATSTATSTLAVGTNSITATYLPSGVYTGSSGNLSQIVNKASSTAAVASLQNPSTFGQSVTFTATVNPATATGTVQFQIAGANHGAPVALSGGTATSAAIASLAVGTHTVTATYSGDGNYNGSSGTLTGGQNVQKANTTTTVTSLQTPSSFGVSVTFTATVAPATATGTVQFQIDGANHGAPVALSGGTAVSAAIASLSVGTHTVTATYSGDGSYNGSSGTLTGGQVVQKANTTTAVATSGTPSTFGQSVTFTATVAPASARGTVQFQIDGANHGAPVALAAGSATSGSLDSLAVGTHTVTATYSGDGSYNGSSGTLTGGQVVQKADTTSAVATSLSPSAFGQAVTFTATVAPAAATGTVQFQIDGADFGTPVALSAGSATSTSIDSLAVGTHVVTATYSGDGSYNGSTGTLTDGQVVQKAAVVLALTSAQNPIVYGASVAFTAAVTPATATGTIQFRVDGADFGAPLALSGGTVTSLAVPGLTAGTHTIQAVYSGDGSYLGATESLGQQVDKATSAVALVNAPTPSLFGQGVVLTATVTSPSLAIPTGTVTFLDGTTTLATGVLDATGVAAATVSSLLVGTHSLTASFGGDANHDGSVSAAAEQVVEKAATTTTLTLAPNPSLWGQKVTLTATVAPVSPGSGTPTGTVTFTDGTDTLGTATLSGGVATLETTTFIVGNHTLAAAYSGDDGFLASSDTGVTQEVKESCVIGSDVWANGTPNPANPCQVCDSSATVTDWTNRPSGFTCPDDAIACTSDVCDGAGACTHPVAVGCLIGGTTCVAERDLDPANDCKECNPAQSLTTYVAKAKGSTCTDDGSTLTSDVCDGAGQCTHPINNQCVIGGTTFAGGAANPANSCQYCDPIADTAGWTNRVSGFQCASDGLSCTWDTCDGWGTCKHDLYSGCLISGACVAARAADPANECQECNPAQATGAYVAKARGATCTDDGQANTQDVCDGSGTCSHPLRGQCVIDGTIYDAGTANPESPCQWCDPAASVSAWTNRVQGFPCTSDSLACTSDVCDGAGQCKHELFTGCLIAGACVGADANDPANECRACNPALATDAYSAKARGVSCTDDGQANTLDVCDAAGACTHTVKGSCTIDGKEYAAGTANPANGCESCDPSLTTVAWTDRVSGFPCASDGLSCTDDVCDGAGACIHELYVGCLVGEACVASGTADPENECRACVPSTNTSAYVDAAKGVACGDDGKAETLDVCDGSGACTHPIKGQCTIDGKVVDGGTANPESMCQVCDPSVSTTGWSNRIVDYPCTSDGLSCTADHCDGQGSCIHELYTGCLISGACVAEGAADPANECKACVPPVATDAYSPKAAGVVCTDDGEAKTLDVCDGAAACVHPLRGQCAIGGASFDTGTANPENPCQWCDPATSSVTWTNRPAAFPCTSDGLSCTLDVCDAAGACLHQLTSGCVIDKACVAKDALHPSNDCFACVPDLSTTAWSIKPGTPACENACLADGDCAATSYCAVDTAPGSVCRPKQEVGTACTEDKQCGSGKCLEDRCIGLQLAGGCGCGQGSGPELAALALAALVLVRRRRSPLAK